MTDVEQLAFGPGSPSGAGGRLRRRWADRSLGGTIDSLDDFAPLGAAIDDMLSVVAPGEIGKLKRSIGTELRRVQAARIRRNLTPDGEAMTPRKPREPGNAKAARRGTYQSRKMKLMFQRATRPAVLRARVAADEVQVGFLGAMARVMRVHHYGLRDHVTRRSASPEVTYPARPLIGLTDDDRARILARVAQQVGA